MINVLFFL